MRFDCIATVVTPPMWGRRCGIIARGSRAGLELERGPSDRASGALTSSIDVGRPTRVSHRARAGITVFGGIAGGLEIEFLVSSARRRLAT
jgi:hypothetical protein